MSGGRFDYKDSSLAHDIFGWRCNIDYGLDREATLAVSRKIARENNPFEDKEISEMIYDMFCLIHSYDWYASGDTGEDDYRNDVRFFKEKWFGKTTEERIKQEIEKELEEIKKNLLSEFCYKLKREV